eukprot:gene25876-4019_t
MAVVAEGNDYIKVGDEVSFFTQEKVKGFMSCPLSTPQYCTALIVPSSGKKEEEDGAKTKASNKKLPGPSADLEARGYGFGESEVMPDDQRDEIGNFQSCVFQIMAEEKYKRVRKLEKLIEKKKGEDRKRRVVEQQNR